MLVRHLSDLPPDQGEGRDGPCLIVCKYLDKNSQSCKFLAAPPISTGDRLPPPNLPVVRGRNWSASPIPLTRILSDLLNCVIGVCSEIMPV